MAIGPWETLGERQLVKTKWLDARVETCRTPSGAIIDDYMVLHYTDWSLAVALTPDRRLVMTRQWRQGAQMMSLECAGGVVDPGETPAQAAARELLEETGYRGEEAGRLVALSPNPAIIRNHLYATLFTDCEPVTAAEEKAGEVLETVVMTGAEVYAQIQSGALDNALQVAILLSLFAKRPDLLGPAR